MDDLIIQKITEQIDIVALVSEFVKLEKKGKNYMGLCPFHAEKSPSFSVSPEKKIAKCMGCGAGGSVVNFYRQIKNISYDEAVIQLAERLGIKIEKTKVKPDVNMHLYQLMNDALLFYSYYLKNSESGKLALKYLSERGIDEKLVNHFNLGLAPTERDSLYQMLKDKGHQVSDMINLGLVKQNEAGDYYDLFTARLMFPITNKYGKVVGFSGRTLNKDEKIKYINSPETKIFKKGELLYQLHEATRFINQHKKLILHEGFFDVMASHRADIGYGVATMGTALTDKQAQLIKEITNHVVLMYDGDKAGLTSMIKAFQILKKYNLKIDFINIPNKLDPDDYFAKFGKEKYLELLNQTVDYYQFSYNYYRSDKDFSNSNDISEFKRQMTAALKTADPVIINYYKELIKNELGIEIKLRVSEPYPDLVAPPDIDDYNHFDYDIPAKPTIKKFSKAEYNERRLIAWLIRIPELVPKVSNIDLSNANPLHVEVITALLGFYQARETFNLDHFVMQYPEHRDYITDDIMKLDEIVLRLEWKDSILDDIINKMKEAEIRNQEMDLRLKAKKEENIDAKFQVGKEFNELQRKVKKKGESKDGL